MITYTTTLSPTEVQLIDRQSGSEWKYGLGTHSSDTKEIWFYHLNLTYFTMKWSLPLFVRFPDYGAGRLCRILYANNYFKVPYAMTKLALIGIWICISSHIFKLLFFMFFSWEAVLIFMNREIIMAPLSIKQFPRYWPFVVTDEFPSQRLVTRSFDVFFDLRLNKRFSEHSWGWWFETPSHSLWLHRNDYVFNCVHILVGKSACVRGFGWLQTVRNATFRNILNITLIN